jgi:hypothetical protein
LLNNPFVGDVEDGDKNTPSTPREQIPPNS